MHSDAVPRRRLGRHDEEVSALGLGGYHIVNVTSQREAIRIVQAAIDEGITFLDNAWEYHEGRSEELVGKAIADRRERVFLMTKLCTHGRGERVAMRRLQPPEYLDDDAILRRGLAPRANAVLLLEVEDPGDKAMAFEFGFE